MEKTTIFIPIYYNEKGNAVAFDVSFLSWRGANDYLIRFKEYSDILCDTDILETSIYLEINN